MNTPVSLNQTKPENPAQGQLKTDCHASREFLLQTPVVPAQRVRYLPPDATATALQSAFPALKTGGEYIVDTAEKLGATFIFGALAVKIDGTGPVSSVPDLPEKTDLPADRDGIADLAEIIADVAGDGGSLWGLLYEGIFGLCIPDGDAAAYRKIARTIREKAHQRIDAPLSVGIAVYPTDHFSRTNVIENAVKALDHATFLGTGTTVEFDAVSLNISGDRLYAEGDIEGSIAEFANALRLDPANVNLRNSLGVCYGILKQYDRALTEFEAAIRLAPGEIMAVYNYGLVMLLTGNLERALEYFFQAEAVRGDIFEVVFHIGKVYLQLKQPEEGITYFKKSLALNATAGSAYRLMGHCHLEMDAETEAVAAFTQAVRLNDADADALSTLGHLYDLRNENTEIATLFCERSVEIDPDNGDYHYRLGRLYEKAGRLDEAVAAFEKAAAGGPDCQTELARLKERLSSETEQSPAAKAG